MVHVYALNIASLPDPLDAPEMLDCVWPERREKALRQRECLKRKQSAGASLLLKWVLRQRGFESKALRYGDKGKPFVEGICFSLSHSGDMVICAVGDKSVGCDIERSAQAREKVAERFFAPEEIEYLSRFSGDMLNREFFRLWTMKESYIKMTGEGLKLPLSSFYVDIGGDLSVFREGLPCACHVKEYSVEGYCLSVCSEDAVFSETIEFVPYDAL
ncbi:MAG: 4'-phosphopantetheinyl transferase superfamily protein [Oscillospiraceae bacterium]|nr:4'-phosphopantetheinyl transferase superfamily protein [Oscillospiraceae bacterium]